jgi:hypothetical protein
MAAKKIITNLTRLQNSEYLGARRIAGEALKKVEGKA